MFGNRTKFVEGSWPDFARENVLNEYSIDAERLNINYISMERETDSKIRLAKRESNKNKNQKSKIKKLLKNCGALEEACSAKLERSAPIKWGQ